MTIQHNNILVIENEQNNITLLDLVFRNSNHILTYVNNISEAQKQIDSINFKVVIADHMNAGGDLISFFEQMDQIYPSIQKIILTDHIDPLTISKAINQGRIFYYLNKPIDPERLIVVVNKAISQHDLQQENYLLVNNLRTKNFELENILQELKFHEEKFRSIFNSSSDSTFITDFEGLILESNPYGNQILEQTGFSINKSNILDIVSKSNKAQVHQKLINIKSEKESVIEVQLVKKLSNKYYELKAYPILFKNRNAAIITLRDISTRKEALKKEMQTIILTEEKERRRFAQELHDGIGPLLSTTKLYLQWFNKPNANIDKGTIVSKMEETIEEAFNSIQEISNNISPNTLNNFGLDTAIKKFIQRIRGISEIDFKYDNTISYRLNNQLEITIYRILCELINNTIK